MADEFQDIRDRMTAVEHRGKSNTRRIEELEKNTDTLTDIAKNMAVMSKEQSQISEKVDKLDRTVSAYQNVPVSRWNKVIDTLVSGVVMAVVAAVLALILK